MIVTIGWRKVVNGNAVREERTEIPLTKDQEIACRELQKNTGQPLVSLLSGYIQECLAEMDQAREGATLPEQQES